jgi:hypothetical protein
MSWLQLPPTSNMYCWQWMTTTPSTGEGPCQNSAWATADALQRALHRETDYGQHVEKQDATGHVRTHRELLRGDQLTLVRGTFQHRAADPSMRADHGHGHWLLRQARGFRLLEAPPTALGPAHVVAATSHSVGVSRRVRVPCTTPLADVFVPRYSQARTSTCRQVKVTLLCQLCT